MYYWGKRSQKRMKGVNEHLILCATISLTRSKYDMTIPWMGGIRTAVQQRSIYLSGNSQLDGFKRKSYHQSGNALDIIPVNGKYQNTKAMVEFSNIMKEVWEELKKEKKVKGRLLWGGDWKSFIDMPHYQIML